MRRVESEDDLEDAFARCQSEAHAAFSDDTLFVSENPYVKDLSLTNIEALLDPMSAVPRMIGAYSPVALLIHSGAWQLFGADVTGHHAMNVVLHSLGSVLLAMFLVVQELVPSLAVAVQSPHCRWGISHPRLECRCMHLRRQSSSSCSRLSC